MALVDKNISIFFKILLCLLFSVNALHFVEHVRYYMPLYIRHKKQINCIQKHTHTHTHTSQITIVLIGSQKKCVFSMWVFVNAKKSQARLLTLKFIFVSLTRSHTVDCPIYYRFFFVISIDMHSKASIQSDELNIFFLPRSTTKEKKFEIITN